MQNNSSLLVLHYFKQMDNILALAAPLPDCFRRMLQQDIQALSSACRCMPMPLPAFLHIYLR